MSELDQLFNDEAAGNFVDIAARISHLETLEPSTNAPVIGSGLSLAVVSKTTTYTITLTDFNILADTTAGDFTATLPTAASAYDASTGIGQIYNLMKSDTGGNAVTLKGDGAELIYTTSTPAGANTIVISNPLDSITVQSNGVSWYAW